ncbi:Dihydropteroate synthase-like protein [Phlegmacium glaucopus]|nr:Dihydropteroate synthase-like protein [Phlegmacium glaucopus]
MTNSSLDANNTPGAISIDNFFNRPTSTSQEPAVYNVAIALGSNLGDSFHHIEYALRLLEYLPQEEKLDGSPFVHIINTSFLYKTAPMYVTDQPAFINGACMAKTNIPPIALLGLLKKIESVVGRVRSIRNGPRAVDLDIIFCGSNIIDTRSDKETLDNLNGKLVVPHPRVQEREFVLRPLNDMIPDFIHPILQKCVRSLLAEVFDPSGTPMNKVIPFPRLPISSWDCPYSKIDPVPATLTHWTYPSDMSSRSRTRGTVHTNVMATLNVTPDSFSDGALRTTLPAAIAYIQESIAAGATIVDVGGYSSRPGTTFVSIEEEISRVVPTLQALRNPDVLRQYEDPTGPYLGITDRIMDTPISVDTYRWEVAEAALQAGANCINDIYAFTGPDYPLEETETTVYMNKLTALVRRHAVPVVLMHSRGHNVNINNDYTAYTYAGKGNDGIFLEGVRVELGEKVEEVIRHGVRRWLIIADPGIGYNKPLAGNLEVLREAAQLVEDMPIGHEYKYRNSLAGFPLLIGVSKKSFLGYVLAAGPHGRQTQPNDRCWATAAAVSTSVQQGALITRVHDVREMMDVVRVSDAIWF